MRGLGAVGGVRGAVLAATLVGAGCGSHWDLREGEELAIGCAGLLEWYVDSDGDLWGDPDGTGETACGPDPATLRTASNALDCDAADPAITGRVGSICPSDIGAFAGGSPCVEGHPQGNSEFVATCDGSPLLTPVVARQDCEAWSGWDTTAPVGEAVMNRGLAALETEPEYVAVTEWLAGMAGSAPLSVWLDLRWVGTLSAGSWQWPDGTSPTYIPACGAAEATPYDFYPDLVPGLTETEATLTEHLAEFRAALVWDGARWCFGVADAASPDFEPRGALALCERPRPELADFAVEPSTATTPGVGQ